MSCPQVLGMLVRNKECKFNQRIAWRSSIICFIFWLCSILRFKIRESCGLSCTNHRWRWRHCGKWEMVWLNQRFSQSSLESSVLSFYKVDHSVLWNELGRSWLCGCYAWEISPTLILVPAYLIKRKRKWKQTRAFLVEILGRINFIIIIIVFLFIIIIFFSFSVHPTFYYSK